MDKAIHELDGCIVAANVCTAPVGAERARARNNEAKAPPPLPATPRTGPAATQAGTGPAAMPAGTAQAAMPAGTALPAMPGTAQAAMPCACAPLFPPAPPMPPVNPMGLRPVSPRPSLMAMRPAGLLAPCHRKAAFAPGGLPNAPGRLPAAPWHSPAHGAPLPPSPAAPPDEGTDEAPCTDDGHIIQEEEEEVPQLGYCL